MPDLAPGQGRVAVVAPSSRHRQGGLRLTGGDASGLLAAADYAAGRLPRLWNPGGPTVDDAARQLAQALDTSGVAVDTAFVAAATVSRDRPGVARLTLHVTVPDTTAQAAAHTVLRAPNGTTEGDALHLPNVHAVTARLQAPDTTITVRTRPATPWESEAAPTPERSVERDVELHDLYTTDGLFQDTNHDFVPDDVAGFLSVDGASEAPTALAALSMRLGLETAGMRFPLVRPAGVDAPPSQRGLPVFVGTDHPAVRDLQAQGRLPETPLGAGEGALQVAPSGFAAPEAEDDAPALALHGGDAAGLRRLLDYTARGLPRLGGTGKNAFRLRRIDTDVRRFVQGKSPAGQVAAGLEKLDTWLARLDTTVARGDAPLDTIGVTLAADSLTPGLDRLIRQRVSDVYPNAAVGVATHPTGFGVGRPILDDTMQISWEGDTAWRLLRERVFPAVGPETEGTIRLRLSEGPDVRRRLERAMADSLAQRGADTSAVDVTVLSAYKQGYSWLVDEVVPAVEDQADAIERIRIRYHTLKEQDEVRWQLIHSPTRWLQELYPVDAVLSRRLGVADSLVTFESTWEADPTYRVDVLGAAGDTLHTDTFSPTYAVRPYFSAFPKHDSVRVTTGHLRAVLGSSPGTRDTLVDRRIRTDLERFWDYFQAETVPQIIDYAMTIQDGDPRPENAPFFDALRMRVRLSEPNYRLGVQEHVVSATEALHEDLYFHTLALFTLMGNRYNVGPLDYPGRILPEIAPPADGEPGRAHITMTGKTRAKPTLRLTYARAGQEREVKEYPLPNIDGVPTPKLRGLWTKAGTPGVTRLRFDVEVETDTSVYAALRQRASEARIDRAYPSAERLASMAEQLRALQAEGLFPETLSYDRVGAVQLRFVVPDSAGTRQAARSVTLPQTGQPQPTDLPDLPAPQVSLAEGRVPGDTALVQWQTPIPPAEANRLMATLGTVPAVRPYYMTTSLLGHDIFAMDLYPAHPGRYVSQAKLNAQRPTLYLNAREDGNEVSSTSYVLRLARQAATEPQVRRYLDRVNVTILPVANPDGAQVAYERQQVNPDFMLHSGYYAALGPSMEDQEDRLDPRYPSATVEPRLRRAWLPDIFMNLHGYPSHEWVQYFAGYSAWVFSRNGTLRSWWPTRGYFLTGFDWTDDPDRPELRTAAFAPLDSITTALSGLDTLMTLSRAEYRRYRTYRRPEDDFGEYFRNGVRVHSAIKGDALDGPHPTDVRDPRITPFSITTEAQDETARGDWLRLQARAGLTAVTAALRYLYHGTNRVHREAEAIDGAIRRWVYREKPVLPPEAADATEE
jgi:hypothetical protein